MSKPLGHVTKLMHSSDEDMDNFVEAGTGVAAAAGYPPSGSSGGINEGYVDYDYGINNDGGGEVGGNGKLPPYPRNHPRRKKRVSGRRHSAGNGSGPSRKLKFDGSTMTSIQICNALIKAKESSHYHTLTFDEVTFDANICSCVIDLLKHTALTLSFNALSLTTTTTGGGAGGGGGAGSTYRRNSLGGSNEVNTANSRDGLWQNINFEFCEGPAIYMSMIIQSIFVLDCVKNLFIASDDKQAVNEWLCNVFETSFRTSINLSSLWLLVPVSEKLGKSLGYGLTYNTNLEKLSFSGSTWERLATKSLMYTPINDGEGGDGTAAVASASAAASTTTTNGNPSVSRYVTGLTYNTTLKTLDLSCCNLKDHYISNIILGLQSHTSLTNLDISRNKCREIAMQELGQLLHLCECPLKTLDLREQIETEDSNEVIDLNTTLTTPTNGVPSSDNNDFLDIKLLNEGLVQNDTLMKLKLSHNQLRDDQVVHLARSLRGNRTLEELDLQFNLITDQGVSMFTSLITEISGLRVLLLGGNAFGQEGQTELEKLQEDDDSVVTVSERDLKAQDFASTDDDDSSSSSSGEYATTDDSDDLLVIDEEGDEDDDDDDDDQKQYHQQQQERKRTPRAAEHLLNIMQPNVAHRPPPGSGRYPNTLAEAFQSNDTIYSPGPAVIEDL